VNLKGIAIGNGWVDPYNQYPAYADFAYENNLISEEWYETLQTGFAGCQKLIKSGYSNFMSLEYCQILVETILGNPLKPKFNVYDIREGCAQPPLCYEMDYIGEFLNQPDIKKDLGVSGRKWKDCVKDVHMMLLGDWVVSMSTKVTSILSHGVDVLVYSGDKDFICNWRGGEAWTNAVEWPNQAQFQETPYAKWSIDGVDVGELKRVENLKFLRIYEAGHMVPFDQPKVALRML